MTPPDNHEPDLEATIEALERLLAEYHGVPYDIDFRPLVRDARWSALDYCLSEHGGFTIRGECERQARSARTKAATILGGK